MTIEGAHAKGSETGSVVFSVDGTTVLTRSGDDTVKRKTSFDCRENVMLIYIIPSLGPTVLQEASHRSFWTDNAISQHECHFQPGQQTCRYRCRRDLEGRQGSSLVHEEGYFGDS